MDRTLENKGKSKKLWIGAGILLIVSLILIAITSSNSVASYSIASEEVVIGEVKEANFNSAITVQGTLEPSESYVLDVKEEGTVQAIYVESGDEVKVNDTLLTMENSNLRLEVLQRESQLLEQLNNQRQTRILLNQNNLNQKEQLEQIDYQLDIQKPRYERNKKLYEKGVIALQEFEETSKTYSYYLKRKKLFREVYATDSMARSLELGQIGRSEKRIEENLRAVRGILDKLVVLSPASGRLSDFELQVGQSISQGDRLGTVYNLGDALIAATVDELYSKTIQVGSKGEAMVDGKSVPVRVSKVFPTVDEGSFEIQLSFLDSTFGELLKGQSVRVVIFTGDGSRSLVLPTGQFYNSSGGNWVFKLDSPGGQAIKTSVELGQKNPRYYQVIDGLKVGDRVIISSYDTYGDYDRVQFKDKILN